eukprot:12380113-Alexandrium_andersonii.AAC.1
MDSPAHAVDGNGRGMRGMAVALRATVGREACAVHDSCFATTAALSQLGDRPAPREPGHNDGWYSNDAESDASAR